MKYLVLGATSFFKYFTWSVVVASLIQTMFIAQDIQDTQNEMIARINYVNKELELPKAPAVHVRHSTVWHVEQWMGNKQK